MIKNNQQLNETKLQKALDGHYDFDVKRVIEEGWALTKTSKGAILQGVAIVLIIFLCVTLVAHNYATNKGLNIESPDIQLAMNIALLILVAPFAAALLMMGINTSVGKHNTGKNVFEFVSRTLILTATSVITAAIVQIGLILFILPCLYLVIATGFAIPLVLEKGYYPTRAVMMSIRIVNHQWLKFVQLYLFFFLIMFTVIFTFGLSLIWIAPFYYNVKGILYRDIVVLHSEDTAEVIEADSDSDGSFHA
ncbi:MAG: hypothetical protein GJ680_17550 [Alteromonadaceae bacterium]|nr:hypothetical protein [Alteromonadaceae bacterium]